MFLRKMKCDQWVYLTLYKTSTGGRCALYKSVTCTTHILYIIYNPTSIPVQSKCEDARVCHLQKFSQSQTWFSDLNHEPGQVD